MKSQFSSPIRQVLLRTTLVLACLGSASVHAQSNWDGPYLGTVDFPARLWQRFGPFLSATAPGSVNVPLPMNVQQCATFNPTNRKALADIAPETGMAESTKPDATFWAWYTDCIKGYVTAIYERNLVGFLTALSPETTLVISNLGRPPAALTWSEVPDENKKQLAMGALNFMVSKSIVREFGADPEILAIGKIAGVLNRIDSTRPLKLRDALVGLLVASASQEYVSLE